MSAQGDTPAVDELGTDASGASGSPLLPASSDLDEVTDATVGDTDAPRWYVPMTFVDVVLTLPSTHPVMVLAEIDEPHRELHIPIGVAEGSAIAYAAQKIPTPRPLTHQFATDVFEAFDLTLETVRITDVVGNQYGAEAVFSSGAGMRTIRCRPSDGVCFALRQKLPPPITVAGEVLDEVGYDPASS